jgi:signal transduction histidine kinase
MGTATAGRTEIRYYRDRGEAMKKFIRRFRHEISTPLSGAALHLEVAVRRLQKSDSPDRAAVLDNIRVCQQAVEAASRMLDWIGDFSKTEEPPAEHALLPLLEAAASSFRRPGAARPASRCRPAPTARPVGCAPEPGHDFEITATVPARGGAEPSGGRSAAIRRASPDLRIPGVASSRRPEHLFDPRRRREHRPRFRPPGRAFGRATAT